VPLLALTATATERVLADVLKLLRIPHATRFTVSFNRPNLAFNVRPKVGGAAGLAAFAQHVASAYDSRACGIVYCLSRDECATVTAALVARGVDAVTYHAGMTPLQRVKAQRDWASGAARVACATIAFGMGIDKADVRFVLHFTMPKSIEGLYQEAGRAGRDGQAAEHTLFYCSGDHARCVRLTKRGRKRGRGGGGGSVSSEVALCDAAKAYCTERRTCRRVLLLKYLGERREVGAAPTRRGTHASPQLHAASELLMRQLSAGGGNAASQPRRAAAGLQDAQGARSARQARQEGGGPEARCEQTASAAVPAAAAAFAL